MWTKHWSKSKEAPYWHNSDTKKTTWVNPSPASGAVALPNNKTDILDSSNLSAVCTERVGEWIEKFSKSKQTPYWINSKTNLSTWTKPASGDGSESPADKRRRVESAETVKVSEQEVRIIQSRLENEKGANMLADLTLPRERDSTDLASLVRRLHADQARQEIQPKDPLDPLAFHVVFTLPDEDVSHITRAVQEDEILKTRLKLKRGGKVIDLPSFWDVWSAPSSALKKHLLNSSDPHEEKWSSARGHGYKMATTFMPGYAKAVYQFFGASTVLDPCSGWGDRLLGASAAGNVTTYIGFDPNKNLRPGYSELLSLSVAAAPVALTSTSLTLSNSFQIHSLPFEVGAPLHVKDNSCDLVFTSPPFFDYEMYNPDNPEYQDWLTDFYEPLFIQSARCVKPFGFVCIHIGDTSAGEIVPFLKNRVSKICNLQLVHTLGLTGVMSKKIREVWVFRNTQVPLLHQPAVNFSPFSSPVHSHISPSPKRKAWIFQLTNPPIHPREVHSVELGKKFVLLDDGEFCVGGTKQRLLGRMLGGVDKKEVVYAGPGGGMAQVALAYTTRLWGKKAVIFLNAGAQGAMDQPLVKLAAMLGGDIRTGAKGEGMSLKMAEQKAEAYVAADPANRFLSPFGLRTERGHPVFEHFREALLEALCFVQAPPKRMWLVSGSGFILDVLHSIWPNTKFMVVQVGKSVWREVLAGKNHKLFIAPQKFSENVTDDLLPPYRSVPWYDAKLWQFVQLHGEAGDFIWNVASVPEDVSRASTEAIAACNKGD